jgi:hypothetical protein
MTGILDLITEVEYQCGGRKCMELRFGDERWDYRAGFDSAWNADRWFIQFLSWGPWDSTWEMWKRMEKRYAEIGRPIGSLDDIQAARIAAGINRRGHGFQAHATRLLVRLNRHLADEEIGMRAFESRILDLGWREGRDQLRLVGRPGKLSDLETGSTIPGSAIPGAWSSGFGT